MCQLLIFQLALSSGTRMKPGSRPHGLLLKVDTTDRAVNLYTGTIVPVLDAPYEVIRDIEIKGWV